MDDPRVFIEIQDHTIGVVPGQAMPFRIHVHAAAPQRAEVAVMVSDPLGRARYHLTDAFDIAGAGHVHDMTWDEVRAGQPGMYRLEVKLFLPELRRRIITSRPFEMVVPGHVQAGVLRPVEREEPIRSVHQFPDPDAAALRAAFDDAHAQVQALANGDGSYGTGYGSWGEGASDKTLLAVNIPLVRHTAAAVMGYLRAYQLWGHEAHADLARAGLDYLMAHDQDECGAFVWWGAPVRQAHRSRVRPQGPGAHTAAGRRHGHGRLRAPPRGGLPRHGPLPDGQTAPGPSRQPAQGRGLL